jgi:transcriptional regulator with XRE-family HTH domain
MTKAEIGLILTTARTRAGLTQSELAKAMGTTQPVVARAEGGYRLPTLDFIDRWAKATGTPLTLTFGAARVALSQREKGDLVDSVLGPGRFNPWDRMPSRVEAELLEKAGRGRGYFERLRKGGDRGRRVKAG